MLTVPDLFLYAAPLAFPAIVDFLPVLDVLIINAYAPPAAVAEIFSLKAAAGKAVAGLSQQTGTVFRSRVNAYFFFIGHGYSSNLLKPYSINVYASLNQFGAPMTTQISSFPSLCAEAANVRSEAFV